MLNCKWLISIEQLFLNKEGGEQWNAQKGVVGSEERGTENEEGGDVQKPNFLTLQFYVGLAGPALA